MSGTFGPGRGRSGYGMGSNLFDHVASPVNLPFNPRNHGSAHNSLETSPLFTAASLPPRTLSRESSKNTVVATNRNFSFINLDATNAHRSYPSVFVNGAIVDVNEIVRDIVINKPHSSYYGPDTGTQSHVCPFSHVPITCPVRGTSCAHAQCFDLREFLIAQDNENWKCPICNRPLTIDTIAFDPFYFSPPLPGVNTPSAQPSVPDNGGNPGEVWEPRDMIFDQAFDQF